jgi:hypothetical protein
VRPAPRRVGPSPGPGRFTAVPTPDATGKRGQAPGPRRFSPGLRASIRAVSQSPFSSSVSEPSVNRCKAMTPVPQFEGPDLPDRRGGRNAPAGDASPIPRPGPPRHGVGLRLALGNARLGTRDGDAPEFISPSGPTPAWVRLAPSRWVRPAPGHAGGWVRLARVTRVVGFVFPGGKVAATGLGFVPTRGRAFEGLGWFGRKPFQALGSFGRPLAPRTWVRFAARPAAGSGSFGRGLAWGLGFVRSRADRGTWFRLVAPVSSPLCAANLYSKTD